MTAVKELWTKEIFCEYCKRLVINTPQSIETLLKSYCIVDTKTNYLAKLFYLFVHVLFLEVS